MKAATRSTLVFPVLARCDGVEPDSLSLEIRENCRQSRGTTAYEVQECCAVLQRRHGSRGANTRCFSECGPDDQQVLFFPRQRCCYWLDRHETCKCRMVAEVVNPTVQSQLHASSATPWGTEDQVRDSVNGPAEHS